METKIILIDKMEELHDDDGSLLGYQVFDGDGSSVKVKAGQGGRLRNKWDTLQVGRAYSFTMGEFKGYPFVQDFEETKDTFVKKAKEELASEPSGQTIGMCLKELGELYRSGKLSSLLGKEIAIDAAKFYRGYLLSNLKIPFDGKKLPQFKEKKDANSD